MKQKRHIKLLSKTTSIYLVFTFVAFFFSAQFLYNETEEYIHRELEERFNWAERRAVNDITKNGKVTKVKRNQEISIVEQIPPGNNYPIYTDTLIHSDEREIDLPHRKRISYFTVAETNYKFVKVISIADFRRLQNDIYEGIIPAFLILALVIVLFNFFLSGYFFAPFNKILEKMKNYKVGKGSQTPNTKTTTTEFSIMQGLFQDMIDRTEKEYTALKEYTENMAHEIQTPLTVIRNKTENLIDDNTVMEVQSASVKSIYNEVNHLSKLGNALNLLTKVEHGEFTNRKKLKTKKLILEHIESVSELAELKGLDFELTLADEHDVNIDPILFDIILKNLVKNSLNYSSSVGPIKIETTEQQLIISNYGDPLEFNEEKLFSRFPKENGSTGSVGLGLALVYNICKINNLSFAYTYEKGQHRFTIS